MKRLPPGLPGAVRTCKWVKQTLPSGRPASCAASRSLDLPFWCVAWGADAPLGAEDAYVDMFAVFRVTAAEFSSRTGEENDHEPEEQAQWAIMLQDQQAALKLADTPMVSWSIQRVCVLDVRLPASDLLVNHGFVNSSKLRPEVQTDLRRSLQDVCDNTFYCMRILPNIGQRLRSRRPNVL